MERRRKTIPLWAAAALLASACDRAPEVKNPAPCPRRPRIDPDYASVVIPPNIAPLNFRIREEGRDFVVRISGREGEPCRVRCNAGVCRIPPNAWRRLLLANRAGRLCFDVFVRRPDGSWRQFRPFYETVASDPIDPWLVYRRLVPNKSFSVVRGVYERDLASFRVRPLATLRDGEFQCFNCHTFWSHDPSRFLLHIRGKHAGMLVVNGGRTRKIDTRQPPMFRPLAYASWHPDGRHIAATCNIFLGCMSSAARTYLFQAVEKRGDLVVYDTKTNTLSASPAVFEHKHIETHPCWSPDGQYIYFVRGEDHPVRRIEDFDKFKFDLMRIRFDVETHAWGSPETVMAYSKLGKSCAFPRPSPDGRYVLHILSDRTTYPIHQKSSDVYLLDLRTRRFRRLDAACSEWAESYPRWSSNGRWFVFLSNRRDGLCALPYFCYFDRAGQAHKAFVLPQEDPRWFDTFTDTYNVTELVTGPVPISAFRLAQAMRQPCVKARFPGAPKVDAFTGATARAFNLQHGARVRP